MNAGLASKKRFVIVLGSLTGLAALTIDMSLPAIPAMARALSTDLSSGMQIVGIFMAGLAIGQIPAGLLSDRFGRMPVLYVGMILFTIAGAACAMSNSIEVMLLGRFFQGFAAATGIVVSRAIVRDISSGREAARLMSLMVMIFTLAPMVAPMIGAWLQTNFGWRMPFVAVVGFGLLMLFGITTTLRETHKPSHSHTFARQLGRSVRSFLRYRQCMLGLLLVMLPTAGFLSLIPNSSALVVEVYGYSVQSFGFIFAGAGFSILVASSINRRLLARVRLIHAMGVGAVLMAVASAQLLLIAWLNEAPFWWLWGSVCLYFFSSGFVLSNATAMALDPVPEVAGVAASLIGATQNAASAISAVLASMLFASDARSAVSIMGILGLVTVLLYFARDKFMGPQALHGDHI